MERVVDPLAKKPSVLRTHGETIGFVIMTAALVIAPFVTYPLFLMQAMCFALFACAFNLLIGYVGLLSFGHALYFGWASYLSAHAAKVWGFTPELNTHRYRDRRTIRHCGGIASNPPPRYLFRHGDPGAGTNDVFRRAAGEIHRR